MTGFESLKAVAVIAVGLVLLGSLHAVYRELWPKRRRRPTALVRSVDDVVARAREAGL